LGRAGEARRFGARGVEAAGGSPTSWACGAMAGATMRDLYERGPWAFDEAMRTGI
jgi:hypothetical protein